MQLVTIDNDQHRLLRQPAQEVSFPLTVELEKTIQDFDAFFATLHSPFSKPAGLAGPQVGINKKIIIIQISKAAKAVRKDVFDELPPTIFINPKYTPIVEEGTSLDWEACYSVPDKMGEVIRYNAISYEAFNLAGVKQTGIARGFFARVLQHEIDHIEGKLYIDLLTSTARFGDFATMMEIRKQEMKKQNAII